VLLLLVVFLTASFGGGNGQERERLSGPGDDAADGLHLLTYIDEPMIRL
jgi:hypothetical protein